MKKILLIALAFSLVPMAWAQIEIRRFLPDKPISRALRPTTVSAEVINLGDADVDLTATLLLPQGVRVLRATPTLAIRLASGDGEQRLTWDLEARDAMSGELKLELAVGGKTVAQQSLAMRFLPAVELRKLPYIPEPKPAPTEMLIGAHHCPLWESDKPNMWLNVLKHPERTPALGFYSQENPEVADWETKWAVEHGISFFIYCWYRTSQGGAVKTQFGSAIHDALFKSRFADKMKFTIMWENQSRGKAGVADERDLFTNLLPYWMENYFKHPSYLKVDKKPVLFIYRPEFLVQDLGGVTNVVKAFEKMRQVCRWAGFDGLYILGEYRGTDLKQLTLLKSLGLDYSFAYCWYVHDSPTPERAIRMQLEYIRKTQELNILPQVVTVSQAWSGWADEGSIWKIPPADFERLLRQAKEFTATLPKEQLGSRMLLLDNWNEWGEGHYIAPYREYGFGYLDAVRNVFSAVPREHEDLIPEDIGMGPYDSAIRGHFERERQHRQLLTRKVVKPGAPEGLAAWWTFDEEPDSPVAFDVSGHRLGGALRQARRGGGFEGSALVCDGGSVVVPADPQLSALKTLTIECRVKTDLAGQDNRWMLNRVLGENPSSGFRLGVLGGKPCFEVPLTNWSHHLTASEALPIRQWVHLAASFDGKTMRLYMDGIESGKMERPGEVRPNGSPLVLGNYEVGHAAHFTGLLDDVRLYRRVLPAEEIRAHAATRPGREERQANPQLTLASPLDYQVIQRTSKAGGTLVIRGEFSGPDAGTAAIQARLNTERKAGEWRQLGAKRDRTAFRADMDAPTGGWYRLEVRAVKGDQVLAESVVEHVGIGEVLVVAGQSNAGNYGAEKQNPKSGLVATFDGRRWRPANDPQPGAGGSGGSFMPPFGDAIAEKFNAPVGIVACGVGATSVREWLPKGATFPNPPTLTGHVTQLPSGEWESKGTIFASFVARMKTLGPRGFRAVLWHQGESDANQADPTRTLPGKLYREYLEKLIRESRREIGWDVPWFVAQVSYHLPGDEASSEIRAAQASLWSDGIALEGPDTDSLKGELRENGGRGVHFSGPGLREHAARWVEKVVPWLEQQSK